MMHIFVNAVAASAGGGLTYLRNLIAQLAHRDDIRVTIWLSPHAMSLFKGTASGDTSKIDFIACSARGFASRLWQEQVELPRMIARSRADVLLSTGNFALRNAPVAQILLSRNALYTSNDFFSDLRVRGEYSLWMSEHAKRWLARKSVHWADCTVAPSAAFAQQLQACAGRNVVAIHHGFDCEIFCKFQTQLPDNLRLKLQAAGECARLLFVSHYNYYRNFETLFRALPLIRRQLAPRPIRLFLTCDLSSGRNSGSYCTRSAATLIEQLGIREEVIELGPVPYELLHHVYRACDLYVTPAYAESFAHPLVEAMASGLPIVASDLPVHREICGDAALYAPAFSADDLASQMAVLLESPSIRQKLIDSGQRRVGDFSWSRHVEQIVSIAEKLVIENSAKVPSTVAAAHSAGVAQ